MLFALAPKMTSSETLVCIVIFFSVHVLTQHAAQYFEIRPSNVTVTLGGSALLQCKVGNQAQQGRTQWTKGGFALGYNYSVPGYPTYKVIGDHAAGEYHLEILDVTLKDDSEYECQVLPARQGGDPRNQGIRARARLSVQVPPSNVTLNNPPASGLVAVQAGTEINVRCRASPAKPPARVRWLRNGVEVDGTMVSIEHDRETTKLMATTAVLRFQTAEGDDRVRYQCVAEHDALGSPLTDDFVLSVSYPPSVPVITGYQSGTVLKAGQTLRLQCAVERGNPRPKVEWYRNDLRIDYDSRSMGTTTRNDYEFVVDESDDEAEYRCQASNAVTPAPLSSSVRLNVHYGPQSVEIHGDKEAKAGDRITLSCRTSASHPAAQIRWIVDGKPLTDASLTLQPSAEESRGTVTVSNITVPVPSQKRKLQAHCSAHNPELAGVGHKAAKSLDINILYPPESVKIYGNNPGGKPLAVGDFVKLSCIAIGGNPFANLTWYKGTRKITVGFTNTVSGRYAQSELSLGPLDPSDNNAPFQCRASNAASDPSAPLTATTNFTVLFPPAEVSIRVESERMSGGSLREDTVATLYCKTGASNPPARIRWWREGERREGETVKESSLDTRHGGLTVESRLFVPVTASEDGVRYRCQAANDALNKTVEQSYTLSVLFKPNFRTSSPHVLTVLEGEPILINISASANPDQIRYSWSKDGQPLAKIGRRSSTAALLSRGSTLNISLANRSDAGTYTLEATNAVGTANVTVNLTVKYPATIREVSDKVLVRLHSAAKLQCAVDAYPKPDKFVHWEREGYDISRAEEIFENDVAILKIPRADRSDSGSFYCVAYNGLGKTVKRRALLLVEYGAKIVVNPQTAKSAARLGGEATLVCEAHGYPDVAIRWKRYRRDYIDPQDRKYGIEVENEELGKYKSSLKVRNVGKADLGDYECLARNQRGTDAKIIQLAQQAKPDPPLGLKVLNASSNSVTLGWTPGFDGGLPQKFRIRYKQRDSGAFQHADTPRDVTQFCVQELRPSTAYEFSVTALNSLGASQWTEWDQSGRKVVETTSGGVTKQAPIQGPIWEVILGLLAAAIVLLVMKIICLVYCIRRVKRKKLKETAANRRLVNSSGPSTPGGFTTSKSGATGSTHTGGGGFPLYMGESRGSSVRPESHYTTTDQSDGERQGGLGDGSDEEGSVRTVIEVDSGGTPVYAERVNPLSLHFTDAATLPRRDNGGTPNSGSCYADSMRGTNSLQRRVVANGALTSQESHCNNKVSFAQSGVGGSPSMALPPSATVGPLRHPQPPSPANSNASSLARRHPPGSIAFAPHSGGGDGAHSTMPTPNYPPPGGVEGMPPLPVPMGPLRSFSQELNTFAPQYVHYQPVQRNGLLRRCSPENHSSPPLPPSTCTVTAIPTIVHAKGSPRPGQGGLGLGLGALRGGVGSQYGGAPNYAEVRPILTNNGITNGSAGGMNLHGGGAPTHHYHPNQHYSPPLSGNNSGVAGFGHQSGNSPPSGATLLHQRNDSPILSTFMPHKNGNGFGGGGDTTLIADYDRLSGDLV